ncbi:hypothetical protein FRC09_014822 [Ceratobasidium sp. 395]|nr:hypothetical protein FRC09_014822 [Ceratobasidium sp. 395]
MDESEGRWAALLISRGVAKTAAELQRDFFPNLSVDTVRRRLIELVFRVYRRRRRPLLDRTKRRRRLRWGRDHLTWDEIKWARVMFSDESKFFVFGAGGPDIYYKKVGAPAKPEHVKPVVKHGGGHVMVWEYITANGVGQLHVIDGTLTAVKYTEILSTEFFRPLLKSRTRPSSIIFQHDNDPKHTARLTKKWFLDRRVKVLPWPANSPDMNPIEHVWTYLDAAVRATPPLPTNRAEMAEALKREWKKIPKSYIQKLYRSMPRRVAAVVKAKGGSTNY